MKGLIRLGLIFVVLAVACGCTSVTYEDSVPRADELVASAVEQVKLPAYRERGGGWLRGYRPSKIVAFECTARNALVTNSVMVKGADGHLFRQEVDYRVEPTWGTIGLTGAAVSRSNETMTVSYSYKLQRIDSKIISDGRVFVRRGTPHVYMPEPPTLAKGERLLENRLVSTDGVELFPVMATAEQAPRTEAAAARLTPKTWRKLTTGEPVTILAWGDSVTVGSFVSEADKWQNSFVRQLQKRFPKSKITLVSNGWGGRTTKAFLAEPEGSPHNYSNTVLSVKADLVISEFVNDCGLSEAAYAAIYARLLKDFRATGKEWVILTPHYVRADWMGLKEMKNIDDDPRPYVKFVRKFARENGVGLADASLRWGHLWREGIPYQALFVNNINHPNSFGMSFFADALMDFFREQ